MAWSLVPLKNPYEHWVVHTAEEGRLLHGHGLGAEMSMSAMEKWNERGDEDEMGGMHGLGMGWFGFSHPCALQAVEQWCSGARR